MIFLTPHIIHGADDMAAVYAAKLEERDQYLATIFGSRYAEDDFYKMLPTKEDGSYVSSEMDKLEKDRREALLRQLYESSNPTAHPQQKFKKAEESKGEILNSKTPKDDAPVYVPLSGDGSGSGDVGAGAGGDIAPPPLEPPPEPESASGE
jgi:general secretion pathway protein D